MASFIASASFSSAIDQLLVGNSLSFRHTTVQHFSKDTNYGNLYIAANQRQSIYAASDNGYPLAPITYIYARSSISNNASDVISVIYTTGSTDVRICSLKPGDWMYIPYTAGEDGYSSMSVEAGATPARVEFLYAESGSVADTTSPPLILRFANILDAITLVGDASNVGDWNDYFELPDYGTPFNSVAVVNNTVLLFGGENIETRYQLFSDNESLLEIWDYANSIVTLGDRTFGGNNFTSVLRKAHLPAVTTTLVEGLGWGAFGVTTMLEYAYLPNCINLSGHTFVNCESLTSEGLTLPFSLITELPEGCFDSCFSLTALSFPNVTTVGDYCFYGCTALETINLPLCTSLGTTVDDDSVFSGISGNNITLTINPSLLINNSGNPDGDVQYLTSNNTVSVNP